MNDRDLTILKKMIRYADEIEWTIEKQYLINQHPMGKLNSEKMRNLIYEKMGNFIC